MPMVFVPDYYAPRATAGFCSRQTLPGATYSSTASANTRAVCQTAALHQPSHTADKLVVLLFRVKQEQPLPVRVAASLRGRWGTSCGCARGMAAASLRVAFDSCCRRLCLCWLMSYVRKLTRRLCSIAGKTTAYIRPCMMAKQQVVGTAKRERDWVGTTHRWCEGCLGFHAQYIPCLWTDRIAEHLHRHQRPSRFT